VSENIAGRCESSSDDLGKRKQIFDILARNFLNNKKLSEGDNKSRQSNKVIEISSL